MVAGGTMLQAGVAVPRSRSLHIFSLSMAIWTALRTRTSLKYSSLMLRCQYQMWGALLCSTVNLSFRSASTSSGEVDFILAPPPDEVEALRKDRFTVLQSNARRRIVEA